MIWNALSALALELGVRVSWRDLASYAVHLPASLTPEVAAVSLQSHGLRANTYQIKQLTDIRSVPCLLQSGDGNWLLLTQLEKHRAKVQSFTDDQATPLLAYPALQWVSLDNLQPQLQGLVIAAERVFVADEATDALQAQSSDWFWGVFSRLRAYYSDCVVAAILINLLALAGSMFSMNVYDRVIPNAAMHSLWALAIGVMLAALLEFGLRSLRAHVLDEAGKRADLVLSSAIYKKTLQLQADQRPASPAQWASQVREFESVRDFVSSSTLVVLTDLPFCLMFFAVIAWMGGSLVWVPLAAGALTVVFGAMTQWPIRRSVERYQYESTQKHAMLVESMERLETITALGAQSGFLSKWERVCASTARSAMSSRMASAFTANISQWLQQVATTGLIVYGVHLVLMGQLTVGALIGCSILASRALGPLGQVAGLMARWHNTQISFAAVNKLMSLPLHAGFSPKTFVSMERFKHHVLLDSVVYQFPRTEKAVLNIPKLQFQIGEVTAVMGPVGSGKSSLLRLLAGLLQPSQGRVWVDGLDMRHISPADWLAQVSWVSQDVVLFKGSLRENLLIASPRVNDERFLQVLSVCGLDSWVMEHPMGLDMPLGEAGQSLSGGQRQMVALARALLADAPILLLDEPTSAMDMAGEQQLLTRLAPELKNRLVVIATHRPGPLEWVSRLLILDQGRIAADGPRDAVLQAVSEGKVHRARPVLKPVTEVAA